MTLTAAELALQFDPYTRALWHLELLGCYAPDDAIAPYLPPPARAPDDNDDDWDDDWACTRCGGVRSAHPGKRPRMERLAGLFRAMLGNISPTKHPDQIRPAEHDDPHRGNERDGEQ